MWRNSLGCFMFFLFLIVSQGCATPFSNRDNFFRENELVSSTNTGESPLPVTPTIDYADTARSCLYVSPDLPPCHFNRDDSSRRYRRYLDESDEGVKLNEKLRPSEERVIVYAIQGCLPARLPFRMALCESKESLERATRVWKLYPFRGTEEDRKGSFVFPRFDFDRWTRAMKLLEEEQRGRRKEEKTSGRDDRENSFLASREYFPASISSSFVEREQGEEGSAVSNVVAVRNHSRKSTSTNGSTNERRGRRRGSKRRRRRSERPEESSRDRRDFREGSEFPYSKSIPFDPKRLGDGVVARSSKFLRGSGDPFLLSRRSRDIQIGSEFPYWKAIPYDPKKLEFDGNATGNNRARKLRGFFE